MSFNTTLVTVLFILTTIGSKNKKFQYNSCYCSINSSAWNVSPFAQFQYNSCYCSILIKNLLELVLLPVSIQLLLLFYRKAESGLAGEDYVSIQLLLLFYVAIAGKLSNNATFQYNSCYCSIRENSPFSKQSYPKTPEKSIPF